ncbi:LacI family DNA-binding transcriptional regulator [Solicola gregarius]|uniref:LacI family transcriptional regulator n=1 Tax=Solicola gregarius TaxID=2908642 RepID=A0AA46YIV1_9ACTN|nr:LacI family DNA-binding transcriptional regulator [Solicola gregarius]UYM03342.1 LacI family transcriptional regulator [Solicola gregarius]
MAMQPIQRKASIKDVAAAAGVSLGTVSNVLNRPDRVSETTRARVEDAMAQLGFIRNESARQLRAGHSRTVAYVMLDVANPFFTDVAQGIEDVAHERDLSVILCASRNDAEREQRHLRHLQQQQVHGILITPVEPTSPLLDEIARTTPLVIVDRTRGDDAFSTAAADDVDGGRLAVEHLLDLGHSSIAYIGGPKTLGQVRDRHDGARMACEEAGAGEDALVEITTSALGFADGRAAGERLAGMPRRRRPTAAFCANDLVALGLLQHAILTGWRVPEDLAIVGFDDIDFAAAAAVPLTSVRQPRAALGRAAAELLLDEANDADQPHRQLNFTPELVARASTGF